MDASRAEVKIKEILQMNDINFAQEYVIPGLCASSGRPLRFDFAIFDDDEQLVALIEYQGKQHYQASPRFGGKKGLYQQQFNDNKKKRFCALNNINLVEIPYTEENLITYDYLMERIGLF